jgi:hypothetical protein
VTAAVEGKELAGLGRSRRVDPVIISHSFPSVILNRKA